MVSTITHTHTATHGSLRRSISDYTAGQLSKRDISQLLAKAVEIDPDCGPAIQEFLDREKKGRRLSAKDHEELTAGLQIPASENIPTEASEGVPDKSGLYRVDDEGTLILSGDFEAVPSPPLADDVPLQKKPQAQGDDKKEPQGRAKSPAGLEVGSILRERFRLDEEVASGSMGLVYKATDLLKLEAGAIYPAVAIKVINPSFANNSAALKSFQNEVANAQHLSHPNIIHLFELDKHGDHFFITMEWLEGESLDALLDRSMGSALPPIQAYAIIEQLCDALAYAHGRNVVHADIKPGNVFLTKPGELKLIDFGIAHIGETKRSANNLNKDPQALGLTPAYASCEALEKEKPTSQDDLFSLACLVYRLLSGRRAFGSLTALQAESEGVELVPIGGMSESRWEALAKALSFRRCDRQPDVTTFAKEFGQRTAPRQYDIQPEVDDAVFTETVTLQALPESLDVPEVLAENQSENEPEIEISDSVSANTTALDSSAENVEIFPAANEPDDILIVNTAEVDLLPDIDAPGGDRPEAEADDLVFTETQSLGIPPENLEATASDTVNLDETAPLGAASFEPGTGLLGTGLIGSAPGTSPVNEASTDTEDLGEMPEPINFFDSDCDDSVFVPLDDSAIQAAEQNTCVDTEEVEVLPADSLVAEDAVEAPIAVERSPPAQPSPVGQEPARQSLASVAAKLSVKPASPVAQQALSDSTAQGSSPAVAALAGGHQATQVLTNRGWLTRITGMVQANPLQIGGGLAAVIAVVAAGIGWSFGTGDETLTMNAHQSAEVDTVIPTRLPEPGVSEFQTALPVTTSAYDRNSRAAQQTVVPTELFFSLRSQAEIVQPAMPVHAADTGIAAGNGVVAVPLSLSDQSASGGVPTAVGANVGARTAAQAVSPDARPVTAGYIIGLHNLARMALAAGDLTEPADASAVAWVDKMLASEPNSKETLGVQTQLAAGLMQRAEQAAANKDINSAVRFTGMAKKYGADDAGLTQLGRSIANLRMQLARQTDAANKEAEEQATTTTEADEYSVEIPVSLSEIEFTRYSEPVFPSKLLNTRVEGWVDVSFTIGANGETRDIEVTDSNLPADFVSPSIYVVESWAFKPYVHNGTVAPVNSAVRLHYAN